jgi:prophage tail gpP-like protein
MANLPWDRTFYGEGAEVSSATQSLPALSGDYTLTYWYSVPSADVEDGSCTLRVSIAGTQYDSVYLDGGSRSGNTYTQRTVSITNIDATGDLVFTSDCSALGPFDELDVDLDNITLQSTGTTTCTS